MNEITTSIIETNCHPLNEVLDSSVVGVFILDADFKIILINRAIEDYFGIHREDVIGKDKRQLISERIKNIFANSKTIVEKILATYDNNTYIENFECHVLPAANRQERWLEHQSLPIRSGIYTGGRIEHYVDITNRKLAEKAEQQVTKYTKEREESEQRYRLLASMLPVGVFHLDSQGNCLYANHQFTEITGLTAEEAYAEGGWEKIIHSDNIARMKAEWFQAAKTNSPYKTKHHFCKPDGSITWVLAQTDPQIGENGQVKCFIGTFTDITELHQAEEKIRLQKRQLNHIGRLNAMGEVATSLAHQLNQPLTVISSYAQMLNENATKRTDYSKMQKLTEKIIQNAKRASNVVQKMRVFFKTGSLQKNKENINDIIVNIIPLLEHNNFDTDFIKLDLSKSPPILAVDKIQIEQVILNIIQNSIEAMVKQKNKKNQITIKTSICDDNLKIIITDSGIGFPSKIKTRLFEPFFTTKSTGMGMGLAICLSIVEAHDGQICATSTPGKGTRFQITLPIET